jgi:hypothetical protein
MHHEAAAAIVSAFKVGIHDIRGPSGQGVHVPRLDAAGIRLTNIHSSRRSTLVLECTRIYSCRAGGLLGATIDFYFPAQHGLDQVSGRDGSAFALTRPHASPATVSWTGIARQTMAPAVRRGRQPACAR